MANEGIIQIGGKPGIKRDGTVLEGNHYTAGQWCRFRRGLPRKMGGYRSINKFLESDVRTLSEYTRNNQTYLHCGSATQIQRLFIDTSFNTSIISDRTPGALTANANNMWQFATANELTGGIWSEKIFGQVAPNLNDISNSTGGELYYGDLFGTAALTAVTPPTGFDCSGGILALHPYLFAFGNAGYVAWSVSGKPADFSSTGSGAVNVAAQKIIRGMSVRGGSGNSPSGLFWTADALIQGSFVGGSAVFNFNTLSTQSSLLGAQTVIEYDGIFYWAGVDRFLMFNGVVREVPNDMNADFFFDNLNFTQRQKVFAVKMPRWGEIWWCFPKGASEEPNHAVVFNVRENTWYDTPLPNGGRGAGIFPSVFRYPLMTGVDPNLTDDDEPRYRLWVHEVGTDEIDGQTIQPVQSFFETTDISIPLEGGPNKHIQTLMLEPDFVQTGGMTAQVVGRANARAPDVYGPAMTFVEKELITVPEEQVVYFKEQRRQLRLRFESNTLGGFYQMGVPLLHTRPGDGTTVG